MINIEEASKIIKPGVTRKFYYTKPNFLKSVVGTPKSLIVEMKEVKLNIYGTMYDTKDLYLDLNEAISVFVKNSKE